MIKPIVDVTAAVQAVADGAVVAVGGFGGAGNPDTLVAALGAVDAGDLTIVSNNAGTGDGALGRLVLSGRVARLVCSYPTAPGAGAVLEELARGRIDLQIVPQGTLAERLRAAGAGLGGVLTPTGVGTRFAAQREIARVAGREFLIEPALHLDVALVHAHRADAWGNLHYRHAAHNFNHVMATAAAHTVVEADEIDPAGLDPESIHTPGIFVDVLVGLGGPRD